MVVGGYRDDGSILVTDEEGRAHGVGPDSVTIQDTWTDVVSAVRSEAERLATEWVPVPIGS